MKYVGIIAEYNPFHYGHLYQIQQIKKNCEENCCVIVCMSGNYVQRGEPALYDKWKRAEMAATCGADLVIEIPTPWAMSRAQKFASGGVQILQNCGCIDFVSFGSENGVLTGFDSILEFMKTEKYKTDLRERLSEGDSFAVAREETISTRFPEYGKMLSSPNDNLILEYLQAMQKLNWKPELLTVKRIGAEHDGKPEENISSASHIRSLIRAGKEKEALTYLPPQWKKCINEQNADIHYMERAILAKLRVMDANILKMTADCGNEGLENRIIEASKECDNLDDLIRKANSKRYPSARIRRIILSAFLEINENQFEKVPYLRILAFNQKGREALAVMKKTAKLPIITKAASVKAQEKEAIRLFEKESVCTDLYNLMFSDIKKSGSEWRETPRIVK